MSGGRAARLAACALLAASACRHASSRSPGAVSGAPTHSLDGGVSRVALLARQLVAGAELPAGSYGFYCYLLFADKSKQGAPARRAAAAAYLRLYTDVVEASRNVVGPEQMAILLAPVRNEEDARQLVEKPDVETFLERYNYDRARVLFNALAASGKDIPRVAVVASRRPLESTGAIDPGQVWVVDLLAEAEVVEERILTFERKLEAGVTDLNERGGNVLLRTIRGTFALVGAVVLTDLKSLP